MLKRAFKQFLLRTLPGPAGALQIVWQRRHVRRLERRLGVPRVTKALVARHGLRVLGGPFAGMAYVPCAVGSALLPKLVGCYEAELQGVLALIMKTDYSSVIDIGCAEGYYATGLALHLPAAHVYAFDTDRLARKLCSAMSEANGVADRVTLAGKCDVEALQPLLTGRVLVVCDCEGYENELLRPDLAPGLKSADVLVELHECFSPGVTAAVTGRFSKTHEILMIDTLDRNPSDYPDLQFLAQEDQRLAVSELRPVPQQWAFMTVKAESQEIQKAT